jgi:hypothetical protein
MDLPEFSVMPAGLDDCDPIWKRREHVPTIIEPRLLDVVRLHLGPQVEALRPFPGSRNSGHFPRMGQTMVFRPTCSRSGSAARDVTT